MRVRPSAIANAALALFSALLTAALIVFLYEVYARQKYEVWRAGFDNQGWLGKVTIPSEDPILMWQYRPNATNGVISTNNQGYRGPDFQTQSPPEVRRIAFVGDSVTLGWDVPEDQTFVRLIERRARSRSVMTETLNFGVDGYNVLQVAQMVASVVPRFSPNVIVYVMCMNDFDFTESSGDKIRYFRRPGSFMLERLELMHRQWASVDFHLFHFKKNGTRTFESILRMQSAAQARGTMFLVAIVPAFYRDFEAFEQQPTMAIHNSVASFLRSRNIPFVDTLDAFRVHGAMPSSYAPDIWHPNPRGHEIIAESLYDYLEKTGALAPHEVEVPGTE